VSLLLFVYLTKLSITEISVALYTVNVKVANETQVQNNSKR
jgi:hypothetical protein